MDTLPQPESAGTEARAVSDILAKANPAEMPAMRTSLSFLTSAGAELAKALERRDQELDELRGIIAVLPPEWVEAAKTGASLPDVGALRAELQLVKDERDDLQAMLVERNEQAQALEERIAQAETSMLVPAANEEEIEQLKAQEVQLQADLGDRAAEVEDLTAKAAELQASLDQIAIARAGFESDLKDRDAELADIENQLSSMTSQLSGSVPPEGAPDAAADVQDPRQRRAIKLGALAAALAAASERSQQQSSELQIAMAEMAALNEQINTLTSEKLALEANVDEQIQSLTEAEEEIDGLRSDAENLTGQVGELNNRVAELQTDLDASLTAKAQLEEQLKASQDDLAALKQQVDHARARLTALLPEDVITRLAAKAQDAAPPAEEGGNLAPAEDGGADPVAEGQQAHEAGPS